MSLSPAAADPPPFQDQGCRIAEKVPMAKATSVAATIPPTISHMEERLLRLEAQELEHWSDNSEKRIHSKNNNAHQHRPQ
jgi:hypothetical protein